VVDFFTFLRVRERGGLTRNREVLVRGPNRSCERRGGPVPLFCAVRRACGRQSFVAESFYHGHVTRAAAPHQHKTKRIRGIGVSYASTALDLDDTNC
jgi:hypothetical protein